MLLLAKRAVKAIFRLLGFEIHYVRKGVGVDAFADMRMLAATESPVIFDVGANVGQSIGIFRKRFERPSIHSFEPGRATFEQLQRNMTDVPDLQLNNVALGATSGSATLIENERTDMSSLLEPGPDCWGEIERRYAVDVTTVDDYCSQRGIEKIDILKIDTQGFDLEVLRGAERMLTSGAVRQVFMEITFSEMYIGLPRFDETFAFLADRRFRLVAFYDFYYQRDRAAWTDGLFIHE
jgi:FkbM family methyltransferase